MPDFLIKSGHASDELRDWLKANEGKLIRISAEVESKADAVRRSFHKLLTAVHKSGEHNIVVNGDRIVTFEDLKNYYKLAGCDFIPDWYRFKRFRTKNGPWLKETVNKKYGPEYLDCIVEDAKSWTKMNKDQKCKALDHLFTNIDYSGTNNKEVMEWYYKIKGDPIMLNWLKWDKFKEEKQVKNIKNKFKGEMV